MVKFKIVALDLGKVVTADSREEITGKIQEFTGEPKALAGYLRRQGLPTAIPIIVKELAKDAERFLSEAVEFLAPVSIHLDPDFDLGMLDVPGAEFRVMAGEVTIGMFRQFMEETKGTPKEYIPEGHNCEELTGLLYDTAKDSSDELVFVNIKDIEEFIGWAKEKTGKKLRLPTSDDWSTAVRTLKNQLRGGNLEWTSTPYDAERLVLLNLHDEDRSVSHPEVRCLSLSFRLVEDL